MVRITIDDELKQKLLEAQGSIELCDSDGRLIGRVTPATNGPENLSGYFSEVSDDEVERMASEDGDWLSTAEFKKRLEELP